MKRSFAYLLIALALSLVLAGCSDRMDGGVVSSSPAPVTATPAMPLPSADVAASPLPETEGETGTAAESKSPQVGGAKDSVSSPKPSSAAK